jgi:hypothetical protein
MEASYEMKEMKEIELLECVKMIIGERRMAMTYTIPPFPLYNPKPFKHHPNIISIDKNKFYEKNFL